MLFRSGGEIDHKPGSVAALRQVTVIHLGCLLPEHLGATYPEAATRATLAIRNLPRRFGCERRLLFSLAPDGVYHAVPVTRTPGELLPHPFTLTEASRLKAADLTAVCSLWHFP